MKSFSLFAEERESKPRSKGLSVLIDNGVPTGFFQDTMESHGNLVDMVIIRMGHLNSYTRYAQENRGAQRRANPVFLWRDIV